MLYFDTYWQRLWTRMSWLSFPRDARTKTTEIHWRCHTYHRCLALKRESPRELAKRLVPSCLIWDPSNRHDQISNTKKIWKKTFHYLCVHTVNGDWLSLLALTTTRGAGRTCTSDGFCAGALLTRKTMGAWRPIATLSLIALGRCADAGLAIIIGLANWLLSTWTYDLV